MAFGPVPDRVSFTPDSAPGTGNIVGTVANAKQASGCRYPPTSYNGVTLSGTTQSYVISDGAAWETGLSIITLASGVWTCTRTVLESYNADGSVDGGLLTLSAAAVFSIDIRGVDLDVNGLDLTLFGDGSDGTVTVTSAVTLSKDMNYASLKVSGSGSINTAGYRIFVQGTLDLSAASASAIYAANSGTTSGTVMLGGGQLPFGPCPTSGVSGTPGAGAAGALGSQINILIGAPQVVGGAGGAGSSGAGGGSSYLGFVSTLPLPRRAIVDLRTLSLPWTSPTAFGTTYTTSISAGGSSGSGDGTNSGGSGGQSGAPGPCVLVSARTIVRGASTAQGAIACMGGVGGEGGGVGRNGTTGNFGGGGGGGGGNGGLVWIVCRYLTGATVTGLINVTGGAGGTGGTASGTGVGGQGGSSGAGGGAAVFVLSTGSTTLSTLYARCPSNAPAAAPTSGTAGSAGAAATTASVTL